ncbi:hypothetical protein GBF38_022338, partial [Nibea albiflora]
YAFCSQLDSIHESDDTSENHDLSSSSEDDSDKTPDKAFDKLSREDDDHRTGKCTIHKHKSQRTYAKQKNKQKKNRTESTVTIKTSERPTSTCVTVRKRSREVDDDGGYDTSDDQSSDIDDGMPDLSAQRAREPHRQDEKKRGKSKKKKEKVVVKETGKEDCVRCLMKEKSLKLRSWKDVKNSVHNTIVTLNRRSVTRKLNY